MIIIFSMNFPVHLDIGTDEKSLRGWNAREMTRGLIRGRVRNHRRLDVGGIEKIPILPDRLIRRAGNILDKFFGRLSVI